jgi:hypothetical protein
MDAGQLRELATGYTTAWCSQDASSVAAFFAPKGSQKIIIWWLVDRRPAPRSR